MRKLAGTTSSRGFSALVATSWREAALMYVVISQMGAGPSFGQAHEMF